MKKTLLIMLIALTTITSAFAQGSGETVKNDEKTVITIWYEGSDARLPFFKAVEAEMQKDYPNYEINAVTFDNSTFMTKVLQSVTATGGVDLVFNDASRILKINQQSGNGFEDLTNVFESDNNKNKVTQADLKLSSSNNKLIVYPINRSIAALGVKTDVEGVVVNEQTMPNTWDQFVSLGQAFKKAGLPGFTMHLGTDPGQIFNLFMCGSAKEDIWLNNVPVSQIANNQEYFKAIIEIYNGKNAFWDEDATSESFAEMYTKIQSSSVGMFRVGNWNAGKWDQEDSGVGEYITTTWPKMSDELDSGLVLLNTRGLAMPKNAENKEAAKTFLKYVLNSNPQFVSFETMGSCIDTSVVDSSLLTKNQKIFFDSSKTLYPIDTYVAEYSYYPEMLEVYEKGLTKAFNSSNITAALAELDKNLNKVISENK